jgi:hypothetical protein
MEQWKAIPGYEGLYECSDEGRVRSLDRIVEHPMGNLNLDGRLLRPTRSRSYWTVKLFKNGRGKTFRIHKLVADLFIGGEGPVLHGPGGQKDNSVSNLRRGTQSENLLDAYRRDGTRPTIAVRRSDGTEYNSIQLAAEDLGVTNGAVWNAVNGRASTCGGFTWEKV